jgi:D-threo-aldose 1-dehydrogenase
VSLPFALPRLALGCAPLAGLYGGVSEAQAHATVAAALELGVTCFDTAPLYGAGLSERRLGAALRGARREDLIIATKVGRLVCPDGRVVFDWSAAGVRRSLAESLERLGHDPDDHYEQVVAEALPALLELRAQGVVGAVGAGMNQWQMLGLLAQGGALDCVLLAGRYTLLEQGAEAFLDRCAAQRLPVLLGGVLNSGILATGARAGAKYNYDDAPAAVVRRVRALERVCAKHGVPLHTAALLFPLRHRAVSTLVVGAATPAELHAAVAALQSAPPPALWEDLRAHGLL